MNRWGEVILLGCLALFACIFLISLRSVPFEAQLFPLLVLAFILALSLTRLFVVVSAESAKAAGSVPGPKAGAEAATGRPGPVVARMSPVAVWAWAIGAAAAMGVLGFVWGTGLALVVYLSFFGRARWHVSLGVAMVVALFIFVVFGKIIAIDLGPGALRW